MSRTLRIVYGEECYYPAMANGFRVGPFEMTVTLKDNDDPIEVYRAVTATLQEMSKQEFLTKRLAFYERKVTL